MHTPTNIHNTNPLKMKGFISKLYGRLFGDKGYLPKRTFSIAFFKQNSSYNQVKKEYENQISYSNSRCFLLEKKNNY